MKYFALMFFFTLSSPAKADCYSPAEPDIEPEQKWDIPENPPEDEPLIIMEEPTDFIEISPSFD